MKHFVVMKHFLKSVGLLEKLVSLKEDLFLILQGILGNIGQNTLFFYINMKHLDLNNNSCTKLLETCHGLEPVRDNGGNYFAFDV